MVAALGPILRGEAAPPIGDEFNDLALRLFRWQFARCEPYRRLCLAAGTGTALDDIARAPFVPADAFKHYRLACFPPGEGETVFHTSGTTHGHPGAHYLAATDLYDWGAMTWIERHLFPKSERRPSRFLSLTASPAEAPHSSLVHMIDAAAGRFAPSRKAEYFFSGGELAFEPLGRAIGDCVARDEPAIVFTTAFALVHLLDAMETNDIEFALPPRSRVMETGGYKGRSRELDRAELYAWAARRLGIPTRAIVNEYGMTEMSSQFYDRTLSDPGMDETAARIKIPPPWVRSIVTDPATRREVADGEAGVLQHIDLANLDSCAFIATADAAIRRGDGFELVGRLPDADRRGCSLDYEAQAF